MKSPSYCIALLLMTFILGGYRRAGAQTTVETNSVYTADFGGMDGQHNWVLELKEDFQDFRVQIDSPVGEVLVFLIEPGGTKGTKLIPANRTCRAVSTTGVMGTQIEATLPKGKKLGPGRHTIRVSPWKSRNVGKYSLKVTEPKFPSGSTKEAAAEESPEKPVPPSPEPPVKESVDPAGTQLKEMQAEIKQLQSEIKALNRRVKELESLPSR